ncbi:MAG: VOC family protein [Bacillota bacterium]|nr:VOC family protein [Bacillota bacterium]
MGIKLNAISLFVGDLKKMVEFYRDIIGIEVEWDGNGPHVEFKHEGVRFMMYERKELKGYLGTEVSYPDGLNGTFELAIDLPKFADVDKEFERVLKLGLKPIFPPRDEPWGMRTFYITDPDGNLIEIGSWGKGEQNS